MVLSLHWLLLLWGLQGLLAQDYEEDYGEEVVTTKKKKTKLNPSNVIPENGKCKCFIHLYSTCVPLMFLKVVGNLCRWHISHLLHHRGAKESAATGVKKKKERR